MTLHRLEEAARRRRRCAGAVITAGVAISLGCTGCGGGGSTTVTTTTAVPTTTTTTTKYPVDSPCVVDNDVAECVDYLNEQFMGYDPENSSSPAGVAIRGRPRYDASEPWYFCNGHCFNGQPDCYTAASLLNHRVMLHPKSFTVAMPTQYPVGIVFQPHAIDRHLTKCAWEFDGAAFNRMNGGCGPGLLSHNCNDTSNAFSNICPSTGKAADRPEECPEIDHESCQKKPGTKYPGTCFWKGPAFYSSSTPGVPANLTEGPNEIHLMLKQRMGDQVGMTGDKIPLAQYWNELTIDGKVLDNMMNNNMPAAIAAIMYVKGNSQAKGFAESFNSEFEKKYGTKVHLVELDLAMQIDNKTKGPFTIPTLSREQYRNSWNAVGRILQQEGPTALFAGLQVTIARNAVWNGVYFPTMFWMRHHVLPETEAQSFAQSCKTLGAGFFGGSLATCFNAPLDVAKSRVQLQVKGVTPKYGAILPTLLSIAREEGLSALYKGFQPKVLRMGLGGGVSMVTFESTLSLI